MKAICRSDGGFVGCIENFEDYNGLKNGRLCFKPTVEKKLKYVQIPYDVFKYLMQLDREMVFTIKRIKSEGNND